MSTNSLLNFRSDNNVGAAPEIMEAILAENGRKDDAYGRDKLTSRLDDVWSAIFETKVHVIPVIGGTAANAVALSMMAPSHGIVFAHADAHILADEVNAPGFLNPGMTIEPVQGDHGRVSGALFAQALARRMAISVNRPRPAVLSLTQSTEVGTVYSPAALAELDAIARAKGVAIHMDGARFANAVAHLGCAPADLSWRVGVKVLSLGATKNGCLTTDALVLFDEADRMTWWYRLKQSGGLMSKLRFNSAQLLAYGLDGRWLTYARAANQRAAELGRALAGIGGLELVHPVEANEVFVRLSEPAVAAMRAEGFAFLWNPTTGVARFVTAFDTESRANDRLVEALARQVEARR